MSILEKVIGRNFLNPAPDVLARQKAAIQKKEEEEKEWERVEGRLMLLRYNTGLSRADIESKTFDQFKVLSPQVEKVVSRAVNWTPELDFGVMLHGTHGVGKTHLLNAIMIKFGLKYTSRMYEVGELMVKIQESMEKGNMDAQIKHLINYDILVLDDLGSEKQSEWRQEQLLKIVNMRIAMKKPLMISTNLRGKDFLDRYSVRVMDRIRGMCAFQDMGGVSYRVQLGKNAEAQWKGLS